MYGVQESLNKLRTYVVEKEADEKFSENFPKCQVELVSKIQAILDMKGRIKVADELQGGFEAVFDQLQLLKGQCLNASAPKQLSQKIVRINGLVQNQLCGITEFSDNEIEIIKQYSNLVDIFRLGKEQMALGRFGTVAHLMIINDEMYIWDCIPRFTVLNLLVTYDKNRISQLTAAGAKMLQKLAIFEDDMDLTAKRIDHFNELCVKLQRCCVNGDWCKVKMDTIPIIFKILSNESLSEEEEKILTKDETDMIKLVQEIPQIISTIDRTKFATIMKGASINKERLDKIIASKALRQGVYPPCVNVDPYTGTTRVSPQDIDYVMTGGSRRRRHRQEREIGNPFHMNQFNANYARTLQILRATSSTSSTSSISSANQNPASTSSTTTNQNPASTSPWFEHLRRERRERDHRDDLEVAFQTIAALTLQMLQQPTGTSSTSSTSQNSSGTDRILEPAERNSSSASVSYLQHLQELVDELNRMNTRELSASTASTSSTSSTTSTTSQAQAQPNPPSENSTTINDDLD